MVKLVVLAAGQGTRLRPLTSDRPKCLVELGGRSILDWQLATARACGIDDVVVVGGHLIDQLRSRSDIRLIENEAYASTNMVATLAGAKDEFGEGFVMAYGDIVYEPRVLKALLNAMEHRPIDVVVDEAWRSYWEERFDDPLDDAESLRLGLGKQILEVGQPVRNIDEIQAQYIGLAGFSGEGVGALRDALEQCRDRGAAGVTGSRDFDAMYMTDLLQHLISSGSAVGAVPISGGWAEIDTVHDLGVASRRLEEGLLDLGGA